MIFRLGGVRVRLGFPFFWVLAILLCFDFASEIRLALLFSVLHEAGHMAAILACRRLPSQVSFGLFGMTITEDKDSARNYVSDAVIALAGPAVNLSLAALFFGLHKAFDSVGLLKLSAINALIGAFNLLPVFSLDGGRALECLLKMRYDGAKSEKLLKTVSFFALIILNCLGILVLIRSKYNFTLLIIAVYLTVLLFVKC